MKVGEYIRTDDGLIGKVVSEPYEYKDSIVCDIDFGNNNIYNEYEMYQSIIKSSPSIIELIQVGDYVNGSLVRDISKQTGTIFCELGHITKENYSGIYSIVTKERFESMEYKIEDK